MRPIPDRLTPLEGWPVQDTRHKKLNKIQEQNPKLRIVKQNDKYLTF